MKRNTGRYDRSMKQWAIAFDLDNRRMKNDGYTKSQITSIYQTEIPNALGKCGFTVHTQGSIYHTNIKSDGRDSSVLALMKLKPILLEEASNFCKYLKRIQVFEMEDWSDITEFITGRPSESLSSEEEIEQAEILDNLDI